MTHSHILSIFTHACETCTKQRHPSFDAEKDSNCERDAIKKGESIDGRRITGNGKISSGAIMSA